MYDFENKVVAVTGGTTGIGVRIAERFLAEGAKVAVCGTQDDFEDKKTVDRLIKGNFLSSAVDARNLSSMYGFIDKVYSDYGSLDILVNNNGIYFPKPHLEVTEDQWDSTLDINVKSYFFTSQYVVKKWLEEDRVGVIVNTTSINAESVVEESAAYCTSKAGVAMLTKCLAKDWGQYGIRVNAVGPGSIPTDLNDELYSDEELKELKQRLPLGRQGKPDEIANGVLWLASDQASYVTGQVLFMDGGWLLR